MLESDSKLALSPAPRRKLSETVADQLLLAVRELPPGTKVPSERELTKELGVGRSTVREALNGLAMLGVVEIRHGQGVFVTGDPPQFSEPSAIASALERGVTNEFIEARLIVEVEVARLAARRRTDEDLAAMAAALVVQEKRLGGDIDAIVETAASFNVLLADCAHNEVLRAMIQSFVTLMVERGPRVYSLEGFGEWDLQEHRGLYAAVRDRDAERAAKLMREHIEELARRYRAVGAA
ncbi:MAG: FadR family transcriptional regulator [Actinomycetota bacterium]|nr:FadR family transcriptional regulator [Actinomycetota bacterium]